MATICPACRVEMTPVQFLGTFIDVCPNCAGVWFDEGELTALSREGAENLELLDRSFKASRQIMDLPDVAKRCPRCNLLLESYNYLYSSPVLIDACSNCNGVFVEDNELTAIRLWLTQSERGTVSPTMEARNRLRGRRRPKAQSGNTDANVESLVQALQNWKEDQPGS